jgi:hypothetical protein
MAKCGLRLLQLQMTAQKGKIKKNGKTNSSTMISKVTASVV